MKHQHPRPIIKASPPSPLRKALRTLAVPFFKVLLVLLDAYQYAADSWNLRQANYRRVSLISGKKGWIKYHPEDPLQDYYKWEFFTTRKEALDHMRQEEIDSACREAIKAQGTNFSGRSRNAACPCGSGKKFKACCMIPD